MFVQTQKTPNPNSLKFLPGKKVSEDGPYEILNKNETSNHLIRNILSISGVTGIFLGEDFLSVNKQKDIHWENIKHIVISHINEYYAEGNESIINNKSNAFDDSSHNVSKNPNVFLGAGLSFNDEDLRTIVGAGALAF